MERWYVLKTREGREEQAAALLARACGRQLWNQVRVLKKRRVFRSGGAFHLLDGVLFPGYVFVQTACPEALSRALARSREFPQMVCQEERSAVLVPVEPADLAFLQSVCGKELAHPMDVTRLVLTADGRIERAEGILGRYLDHLVRLNLHRRFAVARVALFNRSQDVLFGIVLSQDRLEKAESAARLGSAGLQTEQRKQRQQP